VAAYNYTLSGDFAGGFNHARLRDAAKAGLTGFTNLRSDEDTDLVRIFADTDQQAAADALVAAHDPTPLLISDLKEAVTRDPMDAVGVTFQKSTVGLTITIVIDSLGIDDDTIVVADPTDTKYVRLCLVYNSTTDVFDVAAHEKTTGEYDDFAFDELCVKKLAEYSVVAAGTTLTEV